MFYTTTPPHNGTHRLFFRYLSRDLQAQGHETVFSDPPDLQLDRADVLITKPGDVNIKEIKNNFPRLLVGLVHPTDYTTNLLSDTKAADFFICGCLEEQDYYLKYNRNTFVLPHIENEWPVAKCHLQNDEVTLGYHGNLHHLEQFLGRAELAINALARRFQLRIKVIYNTELGEWHIGRPDIPVTVVPWDLDTLAYELMDVDIGLVPATSPISESERLEIVDYVLDDSSGDVGGFRNDYVIRFKNSTNAGRAFVFMQLGIPVVGDFCPELCSVIQHGYSGFLAHSAHGWHDSLTKLVSSVDVRRSTAHQARRYFESRYNREHYARNFTHFVSELLNLQSSGSLETQPFFDAGSAYVPQDGSKNPKESLQKFQKFGAVLGSKFGFFGRLNR